MGVSIEITLALKNPFTNHVSSSIIKLLDKKKQWDGQ